MADQPTDPPRRRLLNVAAAAAVLAMVTTRAARGASLLAVRVWPGPDYTRVTLEHDEPLKFSHFMLRDAPPLRLVVDLQDIALTTQLKELVGKIASDDPYIAHIRIGQFRPDVVRLVIELKGDVAPQLYQVDPVGPYRYRLLFDLYPTNPADPLMALVRSATAPASPPPEPSEAAPSPVAAAQSDSAPPAVAPSPADAPAPAPVPASPTDAAKLDSEIDKARRATEPAAAEPSRLPRRCAGW